MSAIPSKFKNKCTKKGCPYSHEQPSRYTGINSIVCKYGEDCRTKNCTFTHEKAPKGAIGVGTDCKNDVNCRRPDCFFNHPHGRLIDHNTTFSSDTTPQNSASDPIVLQPTHSENRSRHRSDSSPSATTSRSHSQSSSTTRMRNCRLGTKCKRTDCYFEHPLGKEIDRTPATSTTRSNPAVNRDNQQLSSTELIEMINKLLSTAEEQQQEFDMNEKGCNDNDDEQVLDVLQQNALKELRSQRTEFQLAVDSLTTEFNFTLSLAGKNTYNIVQLQRIQKQLISISK